MSLIHYLKEKSAFLLAQLVLAFFIWFLLSFYQIAPVVKCLALLLILVLAVGSLIPEYLHKEKYYRTLQQTLDGLEQKRLIASFLEDSDFYEGRLLTNIIQQCTKSMNDEVSGYQAALADYHDYVETWVHEVKLPISCVNMICSNHPGEVADSILLEMKKLEGFVEQALFYERSTNFQADYRIRRIGLRDVVSASMKKRSKELIHAKCSPVLENLDYKVLADAKWLDFILGQLITNSIQYKQAPFHLRFSAEEKDGIIGLKVSDNGIGVPAQDLPRLFEKGFTGENGRKYGKSTGIGLYLCKNLCQKMNLSISVDSIYGSGTTFTITFPSDSQLDEVLRASTQM